MKPQSRAQIANAYRERLPILETIRERIEAILKEILEDVPRIDRISTRVKDVDKFVEKALKTNADGKRKYDKPLDEIEDQIGGRIVVIYKSDVEPVAQRILDEFREIENREVETHEPTSFGYEARHFVCFIPKDIREELTSPIQFFEIQVCTLFEHAWAEANHDLGYKPDNELPKEDKKLLAFAAAQAWGADRIFEELHSSISSRNISPRLPQ